MTPIIVPLCGGVKNEEDQVARSSDSGIDIRRADHLDHGDLLQSQSAVEVYL